MKKNFSFIQIILIVLISIIATSDAFSQLTEWKNYTSGNWVNQILSDNDYLWVASDGGLIKMDKATQEKTFYNRANAALPDNHILSLAKDKEGNIWVGSRHNGVGCFNGKQCEIYNENNSGIKHEQYCTAIAIDDDNNKWLGSLLYLNKFDGKNWQAWTTPGIVFLTSIWGIYSMKFDKDGVLWMGGTAPGDWSFAKFNGTEIETLYKFGMVKGIEIDDSDNKWLATDHGLIKYDGENFTNYNVENSSLLENDLADIKKDNEGNLWMLGYDHLIKYDDNNFVYYQVPLINPTNWLTCLEIDNENIWIGTRRDGIFKFKDGKFEHISCNGTPLQSNNVALYTDVDLENNVWLGTSQSIIKIDNQDKWNVLYQKKEFNSQRRILGVNCAPNGDIWISLGLSDTCVLKVNKIDTVAFTRKTTPVFNVLTKDYNNSNFAFDGKGNVWMASRTGLFKFDGNSWSCFTPENSPLPDYQISSLATDKEGSLWVGSGSPYGGGLCKYDGNKWVVYTTWNSGLPSPFVGTMSFDSKNILWLNCRDTTNLDAIGVNLGKGLTSFDGKNWKSYNIKNSDIPSNTIMDIVIDKNDHLWLATYGGVGLTKFDGTNWEVYNIDNSGIAWDNVSKITLDYKRDMIWLNHLDNGGFSSAKLNFDGSGIRTSPAITKKSLLIYPNPAKDHIAFRLKEDETPEKAEVYDMSGRLICSKPIHSSSVALSELNVYQKGIYLLKIFVSPDKQYSEKLVVTE